MNKSLDGQGYDLDIESTKMPECLDSNQVLFTAGSHVYVLTLPEDSPFLDMNKQ